MILPIILLVFFDFTDSAIIDGENNLSKIRTLPKLALGKTSFRGHLHY